LKLTIGQKILFGYGAAMLFTGIIGIAVRQGMNRLLESGESVQHSFIVISDTKNVGSDP
jgi:CHASE3 domain sensor protein